MALQTLPRPMPWPGNLTRMGTATPAIAAGIQLNAAGEYDSTIFRPSRSFTPTHIAFYAQAVGSDSVVDCRLETVDGSTGLGSGSLVAANANGSSGTISSGATGWKHVALTAAPTIDQTADVCLKILFTSGDITIGNVSNLGTHREKPYQVHNTGTPTKGTGNSIVALYDGATYLPIDGVWPIESLANATFNNTTVSGSGGDERGVRFRLPFKARASGVRIFDVSSGNSAEYDVLITDDSGNELNSSATAVDGSNQSNTVGFATNPLDNSVTLSANTWYRAWLRPSSANNTNLMYATVNATAIKTALPGGADWNYCFRTDGGAPDDTDAARYPLVDLMLDQLDDGAGGSTLIIPGGGPMQDQMLAGAADKSTKMFAIDVTTGLATTFSHDTAGLSLSYRREGGSVTSITPASLAAPNSAHADGGVEPLGGGLTRVDLPDAAGASAAGVGSVELFGTADDILIFPTTIFLNGFDHRDTPPEIDGLVDDWADGGRLDLLIDQIIAGFEDAAAEPAQGAPAANAARHAKLDYIYQWLRNKRVNDGTDVNHYADDGTTINQKQSVADDGSELTIGEMRTGA